MTVAEYLATPLAGRAAELAAALIPPPIPAHLSAGARITLLADYERARDAADLAVMYAAGTLSWEAGYPHLAGLTDPQAAAAEQAIAEAQDTIACLRTAHRAAARRPRG